MEIQLGTKMLSQGLDEGLRGTCLGEKRRITLSPEVGLIDIPNGKYDQRLLQSPAITVHLFHRPANVKPDSRKVIYEVHLIDVSSTTTVNTFNYLDLNGDKKISPDEAESLVKMFMKALSTDIGIDVKTLVQFFVTMHDKDSDGMISQEEFMESVKVNEKVLNAFSGKEEL